MIHAIVITALLALWYSYRMHQKLLREIAKTLRVEADYCHDPDSIKGLRQIAAIIDPNNKPWVKP